MKPIIEVAVKNAPISPCAGRMPTSENGIAAMTTSGVRNERNQPTIRMKISTSTAAKAVPRSRKTSMVMCHSPSHFMEGLSSVKGWTGVVDFERGAGPAKLTGIERTQGLVHFENRIDRALHHARHIADDVGHRHQILVVDAFVHSGRLHLDQFAQRHQWRRRVGGRTHSQGEQLFRGGAAGARKLQKDVHVLLVARNVEQIHGIPAHGDAQGF